MTYFVDAISFLLQWGSGFVFFWNLKTFLPLRESRPARILAAFLGSYLASVIVYVHDPYALFWAMLGFLAYAAVFYRGGWMEKLTAVLVFYPVLIAVNYLTMDMGARLFFGLTGVHDRNVGWTSQVQMVNDTIYIGFLLLRLLFWLGTWALLGKYLKQISAVLTGKLWLMIDALMLAPVVAIFTVLLCLPEEAAIAYPICTAAIFSSFGGIYIVTYLCGAVQTACHARELEQKQKYWQDRLRDEERVRGIYHDMKNHLLILQAQADHPREISHAIENLREQIGSYETYLPTGNEYLDILIRDKAQAARQKGIDFNAVIQLEDGGFLDPLDISTIFGNALDNAMEASEKLPPEQRLITVKAARVRDMLVITVENNRLPGPAPTGQTTKEDAFAHGFGLSNIRKAVQKYDGQCTVTAADARFTLKILLPIPAD